MHTGEAYLQTLSLDQTASFDQIREAYQDLVMVWHPDRFLHNPRLYKKAEAKLKEFNQAYAYLKARQSRPSQPAPQKSRSAPAAAPPPTAPKSDKRYRRRGMACPWLSFNDAAYILNHYAFEAVATKTTGHQIYQSGPFILDICDQPAEVTLSVPCDSVHAFDRILLSIPCKSQGHFRQEEAKQLLKLLQDQGR